MCNSYTCNKVILLMLMGDIDCGRGLVVLKLIKQQLDLLSRDLYGSCVVCGPFESSPPPGPF